MQRCLFSFEPVRWCILFLSGPFLSRLLPGTDITTITGVPLPPAQPSRDSIIQYTMRHDSHLHSLGVAKVTPVPPSLFRHRFFPFHLVSSRLVSSPLLPRSVFNFVLFGGGALSALSIQSTILSKRVPNRILPSPPLPIAPAPLLTGVSAWSFQRFAEEPSFGEAQPPL